MMFNKNTVLSMLLLTAASMGGTDVEGADTMDWTSTRIARKRKLLKANSGGGGTNAGAPAPSFLFLQPGIDCRIYQQDVTGIYLLNAAVGNATTYFSERPERLAGTVNTTEFVDKFEDIFPTSNPNAAVTFTGTTDAAAASNGPLIVVLSQPYILNQDNRQYIEYTITQSTSQSSVASIEQFLEIASGTPCSIFIDSGLCPVNVHWHLGRHLVQWPTSPEGSCGTLNQYQ